MASGKVDVMTIEKLTNTVTGIENVCNIIDSIIYRYGKIVYVIINAKAINVTITSYIANGLPPAYENMTIEALDGTRGRIFQILVNTSGQLKMHYSADVPVANSDFSLVFSYMCK